MMKHVLFTFCVLFSTLVVQAAPITTEKARENALEFLTSGNMQRRVKGNLNLRLAYTLNDTKGVAAPLFHVFNVGDGDGFVIASADDVAVPVLGYCDNGAFNPDDIPVNMQAWLHGYEEEISKARENGVVPKGDAPASASRKKINPMIKSTWSQREPYNDMCVFNGTRCVTGCAATGMAQIMYYWATTGINGKKFRCGSTALPAYTTGTQKYDVDSLDALASFDWDSMTDGVPTTTKGKTAVAKLMRYCGQSVCMDYEEDGSSASLKDVEEALQKYFDYNYSMQYIFSQVMSEEEWQELVYNELKEGKPFLMAGVGTGGHAFICDGYDPSNGKFHFNWGWGGDHDGWFAMTSLRPGGYDFTFNRWGIKGIQPFSASPYAILSSDGRTLSFYFDTKRKQRTGTSYRLKDEVYGKPEWADEKEVEHVVFDSSFSEARPVSTWDWFLGMTKLRDITGLSYLNTSNVANMGGMFYKCNSLDKIDVSHFDTSKVTKMGYMFYGCSSLESLDVGSFNTSNVTSMSDMFYGCKKLKTLDLSHFDTSNVEYMNSMFRNCSALESLDVSHFDTSKVTDMFCMFYQCSSLKSLDVSHFDTSKVTDMGLMFAYCGSLASLDISNFDMSNMNDVTGLFNNCGNLRELYIPATLPTLDEWGCYDVGRSSSPCRLHAPAGFDFGFTPPANKVFYWHGGYFILVNDFAMGDVNHDGIVSINDLMAVVAFILGNQTETFFAENADMDGSGEVSINDVMSIVEIILHGQMP